MKNGDVCHSYVSLPEGIRLTNAHNGPMAPNKCRAFEVVGPNTGISRDLDLRAEGHKVGTVQLGGWAQAAAQARYSLVNIQKAIENGHL